MKHELEPKLELYLTTDDEEKEAEEVLCPLSLDWLAAREEVTSLYAGTTEGKEAVFIVVRKEWHYGEGASIGEAAAEAAKAAGLVDGKTVGTMALACEESRGHRGADLVRGYARATARYRRLEELLDGVAKAVIAAGEPYDEEKSVAENVRAALERRK